MANEWIPVSERLPDGYQTVLVYFPGSRRAVGEVYYDSREGHWCDCETGLRVEAATHWMKLPEPPTVCATAKREGRNSLGGRLNLHARLTMTEWISVTKQMPTGGVDVLISYGTPLSEGEMLIAYWAADEKCWFDDEGRQVRREGVTHWMPLPEPPTA